MINQQFPVTTAYSPTPVTQLQTAATTDSQRPPRRSDVYRSNLQLLRHAARKPLTDSDLASSEDEDDNSANIAAALAA